MTSDGKYQCLSLTGKDRTACWSLLITYPDRRYGIFLCFKPHLFKTLIEIKPLQNLKATVTVPGSKSYTNRALLIAGLTDGECRLEKPLVSDDTKYMIQALKGFGVPVREERRSLYRFRKRWKNLRT